MYIPKVEMESVFLCAEQYTRENDMITFSQSGPVKEQTISNIVFFAMSLINNQTVNNLSKNTRHSIEYINNSTQYAHANFSTPIQHKYITRAMLRFIKNSLFPDKVTTTNTFCERDKAALDLGEEENFVYIPLKKALSTPSNLHTLSNIVTDLFKVHEINGSCLNSVNFSGLFTDIDAYNKIKEIEAPKALFQTL